MRKPLPLAEYAIVIERKGEIPPEEVCDVALGIVAHSFKDDLQTWLDDWMSQFEEMDAFRATVSNPSDP